MKIALETKEDFKSLLKAKGPMCLKQLAEIAYVKGRGKTSVPALILFLKQMRRHSDICIRKEKQSRVFYLPEQEESESEPPKKTRKRKTELSSVADLVSLLEQEGPLSTTGIYNRAHPKVTLRFLLQEAVQEKKIVVCKCRYCLPNQTVAKIKPRREKRRTITDEEFDAIQKYAKDLIADFERDFDTVTSPEEKALFYQRAKAGYAKGLWTESDEAAYVLMRKKRTRKKQKEKKEVII